MPVVNLVKYISKTSSITELSENKRSEFDILDHVIKIEFSTEKDPMWLADILCCLL